MKLIDCVMYSGEREVLSLRMDIMAPFVDRFLVIEAAETFSGQPRELSFPKDREAFASYHHKIDYRTVLRFENCHSAWEREYYLRDSFRKFADADDDDLLIIADTDEIVNLEHVLTIIDRSHPTRIELPTYYYFLNVRSSETVDVTLITPFSAIKDVSIGNRRKYGKIYPWLLADSEGLNGGHFTYLFGKDIDKYVLKLRSFSHTEYNKPYFIDRRRISTCVQYNLDLLERDKYRLTTVSVESNFSGLARTLSRRADLRHLIKPSKIHDLANYLKFMNGYLFRRILKRRRVGGQRSSRSKMSAGQV
jgi:beta-1,4-mannosyl-glycoprotein beta-1,4-N-acetylglucosaminyltransferase